MSRHKWIRELQPFVKTAPTPGATRRIASEFPAHKTTLEKLTFTCSLRGTNPSTLARHARAWFPRPEAYLGPGRNREAGPCRWSHLSWRWSHYTAPRAARRPSLRRCRGPNPPPRPRPFRVQGSSRIMYVLISFRKSTPPQIVNLSFTITN